MSCISAFFERGIETAQDSVQAFDPICHDRVAGRGRALRASCSPGSLLDQEADSKAWGSGSGASSVLPS